MSFSSLPSELVRQVIESSVPHTFHTLTYQDRQDTLCRLSLVSHKFRSIAQPLLLEIASLEQNERLKLVLRAGSEVAFRELVLEVEEELSSSFVGRTIRRSSNLRSLTIHSVAGNVIDLSVLSSCKNLVNLQLSGYDFDASSLDVLPSLQALSLNWDIMGIAHQLLDPQKVPALKALGLESVKAFDLEDLKRTRIDQLLPRLDALCIELDLYSFEKDTLLDKLESRILINAEIDDLFSQNDDDLSTIHHLRIHLDDFIFDTDRFDALRDVNQILEPGQRSKPRQLRSIYVDPEIRPVLSDSEEVHSEFAKLEERCREAGIDLVLEVQGQEYELDSFVSGEFCRRQRKSRENKQLVQV